MNELPFSRTQKRNTALALICSITLILLALAVVIKFVSAKSVNEPSIKKQSTPTSLSSATPLAENPLNPVVPSQSITPTVTVSSQGTRTPTATVIPSFPTPFPSQSASIYSGVYVSPDTLSAVTAFEADARKTVAIVMWYQQWGLMDGWQYFQAGWMNAVRSHGSIPLVSWDPEDPSNSSPNQPTYQLQNIINGKFDAYITRWALDSKTWGHPYFLRFAHEMNGNWYPWAEQVNGNKPGQFVLAWKHIHDIFTRLGVSNVTWVWSPNADYSTSTSMRELYPGDAYVDWVGLSGYNWGNTGVHVWQSFNSIYSYTYNDILSLTSRPIMLAEVASTEQSGNKANWITDAYVTQLPRNYPRIRAVVWFNESKGMNWQIESSPSAQAAFASAIQSGIYASNKFGGITMTPIPAP